MKKFKSKYPKDSKEYLVSYLIKTYTNSEGYDTIYKPEDLNKINLDDLSYVQRIIFLYDMIDHNYSELLKERETIRKLKKELVYYKSLNGKLYDSSIDEETDNIVLDNGKKININEFLKSV